MGYEEEDDLTIRRMRERNSHYQGGYNVSSPASYFAADKMRDLEELDEIENTQPTQKDYTHQAVSVQQTEFKNEVTAEQNKVKEIEKSDNGTTKSTIANSDAFYQYQQMLNKIYQFT